jgi:hypothetical protein
VYWRAGAEPAADAKVFVHLVDSSGTMRAQMDAVPVQWQRPTSGWRPREVLTDVYSLAIPVDAPSGEYTLYVGLYDAVTLTRWPVAAVDESSVADDRLPLTTVSVTD